VHLRPTTVVETGVARGVTTRIILEALDREDAGHLWSIDRPPLDRSLHSQIGAAVPTALRRRWTLLRGTSRRMLPPLLARLGRLDLFVHDSLHSQRNVSFELAHAWAGMRGGGALAVDDVNQNAAFRPFVDAAALDGIVAPADDGQSRFGVAVADREGSPA
jgi:predicted O-methyltransferase YrrM